MLVKKVWIVEYETASGPWKGTTVHEPSWSDIKSAIRRLDRCRFPFVSFDLSANGETPDHDIIGGCGEYGLLVHLTGGRELTFVDMQRSSNYVDIWMSDQGTSMREFELCPDLERTLKMTRYYCETGELDPGADWFDWPK
jgi:hypothetical protein